MNRVVHFEIHAADPERTAAFYRQVFGWDIKEWTIPGVPIPQENRYWVVGTGSQPDPGIDGGIVVRRGAPPTDGQAINGYVCTIGVASVDEYLAKARSPQEAPWRFPRCRSRASVGWRTAKTRKATSSA